MIYEWHDVLGEIIFNCRFLKQQLDKLDYMSLENNTNKP